MNNMNQKLKAFVKKAEEGVSPVVATLMLVLVAAGAAVGIGVFMNGFQEDAEENVASSDNARVLRIGGSSTVYEFSKVVLPEFERDNPGIKISLESGGSGAGRAAVCNGNLAIGSASSAIKDSHQENCKELSGGKTMKVFKVATDGVVFAFDPSNDACEGVPELTQAQAYSLYYHNSDNFGTRAATADFPTAADDLDTVTASPNTLATTSGSKTVTASAASFAAGDVGKRIVSAAAGIDGYIESFTSDTVVEVSTAATSTEATAAFSTSDGDVLWNEIPDTVTTLTATCADGTTTAPTNVAEIYDRKDPGGTSEAANEFLFGGSGKQIEDFGFTLDDDHQGDGNQGVGDLADGNADGLWFTSYGYAVAEGWDLAAFGIDNAPIVPTASNVGNEVFEATRPIQYMTLGEPSPLEKIYLDYVMGSHNNQLFAEAADFESIY